MGWSKLQMRFSKLSRFSTPKIQHSLLLNTRLYSDTSTNKDLFDILEEKVEEDIGYDQWLASTKEALKNSKGRFWIGKTSVSLITFYSSIHF